MTKVVHPPFYYGLVLSLVRPIYRLLLWHRRQRSHDYRREIAERFGLAKLVRPKSRTRQVIWCHAVSLGELNTAYPLLRALLDEGHGLYITSTTQTGFGRVGVLFGDEIMMGQVVHGFVPIDDVLIIRRFVRLLCPALVLFVETELWANTLAVLCHDGIPSVMVNARLTDKSRAGYQRFAKLSGSMMANISLVIAQDEKSAQGFLALGLPKDKLKLAPSLKWSQTINPPAVACQFGGRPVWVAGSTHEGEEEACLQAHRRLLAEYPNLLLILVPRHPERFDRAYELSHKSGFVVARRSLGEDPAKCQVYLADTMGELLAWYQACQVAFVGGSLVAVGGHNPAEPASFAKPVIMGRYSESCQVLLDDLLAKGGAVQIGDNKDIDGLADALRKFLGQDGKAAGQMAYEIYQSKKDAVTLQKQYLTPFLARPTLRTSVYSEVPPAIQD